MAAIRMLFDWLITGAILDTNPATSVRGPKHVIKHGKTPVLTPTRPAIRGSPNSNGWPKQSNRR
jgi:hypothetical protein